ncbi:hypothetical protein ACIBTV_25690 [Micromonospora sp. NPDC049366]|uniref:hypothetical protein n=1 Tax=Micromonospora sp. NPDC049366 TaxID=3364271 RepID=UPI0037B20FC8
MHDVGRETPSWTIRINLRAAAFVIAGLLGVTGGILMLWLAVLAVREAGRVMTLGLWMVGLTGALLLLSALTICGLVALGRLLSIRLACHTSEMLGEIQQYERQLHGEVESYQAGVGRTLEIFGQALPRHLPPNVHPIRPDAEFANAN